MPIISGFFSNAVVGALRAPGQILQWNRNQVNPSGYRHWESGLYRPSAKIGFVGGFQAQMESGRALDFGEATANSSGFLTETVVFTFNLGEVNLHVDSFFNKMVAASSVATRFKAYNMKFWVGDLSTFGSGLPSPVFHMRKSAEWIQGLQVVPNAMGVEIVPSALPVSGNIMAKSLSTVFVSGAYLDPEFSHFVYLRGEFKPASYPLGSYGGLGQQDFTFNFSYDYTDIKAHVLESDLELCIHGSG